MPEYKTRIRLPTLTDCLILVLSGKRGSNSRPSAWEADALPTELLPHLMKQNYILFSTQKNFITIF